MERGRQRKSLGKVLIFSSKKEKLERHIRVLRRHLEGHSVDDKTRSELEEEIKETEEELKRLSL